MLIVYNVLGRLILPDIRVISRQENLIGGKTRTGRSRNVRRRCKCNLHPGQSGEQARRIDDLSYRLDGFYIICFDFSWESPSLFPICRSSSKTVEEGTGTKRIEPIRQLPKVAEGQRSLKNLEEGGGSLKTVEEIRRRRMNEFNSTIKS
jgi:hypothetical protein